MDKQNPLIPYFGQTQEYTVIGIVFYNGVDMRIMDISTINSEEEIDALIEEGYEISAYAITALGDRLDPNDTRFNPELVTGFVNPDGIEMTQEKTHNQGRK